MLIPESALRDVTGFSDNEKELMKSYLQGLVYSWAKNRKDENFAARDLVGGENFEWQGTPLYPLYEKHINWGKTSEEAIKAAAKDLGWLLKTVLAEDKRHFNANSSGYTAEYCWVGNEP